MVMKEDSAAMEEQVEQVEQADNDEPMEAKEGADEEQKEPEKPKEQELDAPEEKRPKVKAGSVEVNLQDTTLNVLPVVGGKILMPLSEGGMQYLLAGARCNTGVKKGRYLFETRIVENVNPFEQQGKGRTPMQRNLLRVGFSLAGSSLLAEGESHCCFDSEGFFLHGKTRKRVAKKFVRDQTVAVLLNLDSASPNSNTISLFVNGLRTSDPIALPEALCGKVLFPTITYRNVSVELNFGPSQRVPLPFVCHMLGAAAKDDVEVAKPAALPKHGKPEVIFPVGLPEQGYFEWVDQFLEKTPGYTELSDRSILEWANKSGLYMNRGLYAGSKDKPEATFGVPELDNWSASRVIAAVAPTLERNYIVPELKANLIQAERSGALLRFGAQDFHLKAVVVMGAPDNSFKEKFQAKMLEEKKVRAEAEKKRKAREAERKKQMEERRKKAQAAKQQKQEQADEKKNDEDGETKAEGEGEETKEGEAEGEEKKEGKTEGEEKKEGAAEGEEKKEETPAEEEKEEAELPVELTEEEKQMMYPKSGVPEVNERELARSFAQFSLPTKAEGFHEVAFMWQKEADSAAYLKSYMMEKKMTSRAEDLTPGDGFKESYAKWQDTVRSWRNCQSDFKDPAKRKAAKDKKAEEAKKELEEKKKALIEAGDEEGAKALEETEETEEKEEKPMEIDMDDLDPMTVEDILNVGNGEPLFANFTYEDWTLLNTRYELHLLVHSFKKDLNDPDRPGFTVKDIGFYYGKYYKKSWNFSQFGVTEFDDLIELLKDSVSVDSESGHVKADAEEACPLDNFVKLTEDNRRERARRIDAGDETARLKFTRPQASGFKGGERKGGGKGPGKGSPGKGGNSKGDSRKGYGERAPPSAFGQKRGYTTAAPSYGQAPLKQARSTYTGGGSYGGGSAYSRR